MVCPSGLTAAAEGSTAPALIDTERISFSVRES
jgi:hypothetical protein